MKVIRRLGNNAAVALDSSGKEVIVLGRGISSGEIPFEINDLSKIEKSFYNVNPTYIEMIHSISDDVLMASADIVEQADFNLDCDLNSNLPFTLADHLQFAIKRSEEGLDISTPIAYDVMHLYPEEYELGLLALDVVQDYTGKRLPESEAVNVALHIINCELENGSDLHSTVKTLGIIEDICLIVEENCDFSIDRSSYDYSRFVMHLRYLLQRLSTGDLISQKEIQLFNNLASNYLDEYRCVLELEDYFWKNEKWKLTKEEKAYLMIHIIRLKEKNK